MSEIDRRAFLRWLAASPVAAALGGCAPTEGGEAAGSAATAGTTAGTAAGTATGTGAGVAVGLPLPAPPLTAAEALDVFDLRAVAARTVPPAHWAYIQTGVDHDDTMRRNREGYERLYLRARRLVGVGELDTSVELFGRRWPTPIVLAPAGSQRGFHADGEVATARAARAGGHLQVLSTVSSTGVEEVNEARGEPVWYQLYPTSNWEVTRAVVRRVADAGCPTLVLTVDLPGNSNRLAQARGAAVDGRDCASCHREDGAAPPVKPMYRGTVYRPADFRTPALTWDVLDRLRDLSDMRFVVKGIVTWEDAEECVRRGVDAVWVSNHGGRAEGSGRATIDTLPEVVQAVSGRVPVIVDGGVRRGTDVFKALARGADAVAIGRPYLWGLGAFGQEGVERALEILTTELEIAMGLAGTPSIADIAPSSIGGPA